MLWWSQASREGEWESILTGTSPGFSNNSRKAGSFQRRLPGGGAMGV